MAESTKDKIEIIKAALNYFESVIEIMAVEADCPPGSPSKGGLYLVKHSNGSLDAYGDFRGKENKYLFYDGNYWSELDVQAPLTTLQELETDIADEEPIVYIRKSVIEVDSHIPIKISLSAPNYEVKQLGKGKVTVSLPRHVARTILGKEVAQRNN